VDETQKMKELVTKGVPGEPDSSLRSAGGPRKSEPEALPPETLRATSLRDTAASAHEVHNLEAVSIIKRCLGPAIPRHDLPVQLHSDSVSFHSENLDQGSEREGTRGVENLLFPVDVDFHRLMELRPRQKDCSVCGCYSALRSMNFRVAVRPSKLACTSKDESGSAASSTSILISAVPPESAVACV
jgi:hypothetical protein